MSRTLQLLAGMPSVTLTDAAKMRFEVISFFAVGVLLSAWIVKLLWNRLRSDFPQLPQASYRGALCGTIIWGLLFIVVLTMISGARELMTPGAWEKDGLTYKLADQADAEAVAPTTSSDITIEDRRKHLQDLRSALFAITAAADGVYPVELSNGVPSDLRVQPGHPNAEYNYRPTADEDDTLTIGTQPPRVLLTEYNIYDTDKVFVLMTDGEIELLTHDEIAERMKPM